MNASGSIVLPGAEIGRFVSALFAYADEGSFISLRAFDQVDRGKPPLLIEGVKINGDMGGIIAAATRAADRADHAADPAVFAPPVCTFDNPNTARSGDVACGVALSVEMDQGNPGAALARLEHLLGPVTMVVASGGEWVCPDTGEVHAKAHFHWRLSEPTRTAADHAKLQDARRMAALFVGGDPTAAPPAHPLRWPGSLNRKRSPRMAMIQAHNPDAEIHLPYALTALEEAVEAAGLGTLANGPRITGQPQAPIPLLASALSALSNADLRWDEWNRIGMAAWAATGGAAEGLDAWEAWSAKSGKHVPGACDARWAHYGTSPPSRLGAGTILFMAQAEGWIRPGRESHRDEHLTDPGYWASHADEHQAEPQPSTEARQSEPSPFTATLLTAAHLQNIPPRPWLYRRELLRGFVSALGSTGGVGKTSFALSVGLSIAANRILLTPPNQSSAGRIIHKSGPIWIYQLEDPAAEMHRRIRAVALHHQIDFAALPHPVYLDSGRDRPLVVTKRGECGLVALPVVEALVAELIRRGIVLLIIDPFLRSHTAMENDNAEMGFVMDLWSQVADRANCAVWLVHHFRKGGQGGDAESFRGAGAIQGAARAMSTMSTMTVEDAEKLNVEAARRRCYVRKDDVKANMAPPAESAEWYELVSVEIGNASDDYPDGDAVQVLQPWEPPSLWAGLPLPTVLRVLHRISQGPTPNERYSGSKQAGDRWAGRVLIEEAGRTDNQAAAIVKAWLETGLLTKDEYPSPSQKGKATGCVMVDTVKAAKIKHSAEFGTEEL